MPEAVRVDNGAPWGSWNDLPPVLSLWLIGLGIQMHWNHPNTPEENGVIERSQGLAKTWGEPDQCRTVRQFQSRINREDRLQRESYPSINGQSRMVAYPSLSHSYSASWEQRHWDWQRVLDHHSGYAVQRKVDCSGKTGIYSGKVYVGVMHKGSTVYVQFDPDRIEWVVSNAAGQQLRSIPATDMTARNVRLLHLKPAWRK